MAKNPTGLWISQGYGWLLELHATGYTLHHLCRSNALAAERGSHEDFAGAYDVVSSAPTRMSLHQAGDITRYDFKRIDAFPDLPRIPAPGAVRDPRVNFDTLVQVFEEHYAFFELHGVDWPALCRRQRQRIGPTTTDAQLLDVFEGMLPLDDGHVSLAAGERVIQRLGSMELRRALQDTFGAPRPRVSLRSTVDAVRGMLEEVILAPFAATRTPLRSAGNGIVSWCRLTADVGYMSVLRLFGFAVSEAASKADDLPHARGAVARFLREDLAALEGALDECLAGLADCRGIVLDLRINGGGFDRCGIAIANRFADRARLAFTKQARAESGLTAPQSFNVRPEGRARFMGPVHVLVSPLCVSAGEILVLCLRALPQVRVLGEPTAGMLSDNLNKPLPNGWELSLSNEIYTSSDGQVFEGRGIAPDVTLRGADPLRLGPALRESLEQAVSMLGQVPLPARHT